MAENKTPQSFGMVLSTVARKSRGRMISDQARSGKHLGITPHDVQHATGCVLPSRQAEHITYATWKTSLSLSRFTGLECVLRVMERKCVTVCRNICVHLVERAAHLTDFPYSGHKHNANPNATAYLLSNVYRQVLEP